MKEQLRIREEKEYTVKRDEMRSNNEKKEGKGEVRK